MDSPAFNHRRYMPFSGNSSFYPHQPHRLPPPLPSPTIPPLPPQPAPPAPPPPHHLSLPPPPPIPPPAQAQFSFRPNPTIEERSAQLSNFIPSHLLSQARLHPRLPSPPRVSSYNYNSQSLPRFEDNSCFSDPWPDMPLLPRVPPESPLHHHNHHCTMSPSRPRAGSYRNDFQSSLGFRDEFMDEGFRDEIRLWSQSETRFDARDDVRYGGGRERYEWNSDRVNRDFVSADSQSTDFSLNPSRDIELDVGNYDMYNRTEAYLRWRNSSSEIEREYGNSSLYLRGERSELFENSGFEDVSRSYSNRAVEKRADEHFSRLPRKKQLHKKSALQRIRSGKANNNRSRSHDHSHFPKGYHDESNSIGSSIFKGKEPDLYVRMEQKMEEEREKSPMELDVSFKSNALIAKAIKATPSPSFDSNRDLMSKNRKIKKINLSDSPGMRVGENLDKTESSADHFDNDHREFVKNVIADKAGSSTNDSHHSAFFDKGQNSTEKVSDDRTDSHILYSDIPSDSDKDLGQFAKKIRVSLSGNLFSGGSEPLSSGLGETTANKESPEAVESGQDVEDVVSDGTIDGMPGKRKRIAIPLQPESDGPGQTNWDSSFVDSPSQTIPLDECLSSSGGMSIVPTIASDFHADVLVDEKVKSSSNEASTLGKDDIDINSSQLLLPQSSAIASASQNSGDAYISCDAADHAETSVPDCYSGMNFDKGVEHAFQEEPILFQNGPKRQVMDSVEVDAAKENKVHDSQTETCTSRNEGCRTSNSEQRLCKMSGKIDFAESMNANSDFPNQVTVPVVDDIFEGSSNPLSSVGNSDILCVSPSKLEAIPKENTPSFNSTVNLQLGSVDIASQGSMDNFVNSNGKASFVDDNCQINLPCMENLASLSNNDVSCVFSTNSADRHVDNDPEALFSNMTSSSEDVPPNLLMDMQNSKSEQSELSNGHSGEQKIFTKSPVAGVNAVRASSLSSNNDAKLGQTLTPTGNSQKMLPLSQNNLKVIQNSNSLPDKSSLSNNWVTTSIHGGFPGRTSVKYPSLGKALPFNIVSRPRTWHRSVTPSQSRAGPKDHVSSQNKLQKGLGKVQNSYVRKGNSLVRKPFPIGAIPQRLHACSPSMYQLTTGIDNLKKGSGSENGINNSGPSTSAMIGGCTAGPERPKTPPLIGTIKSLNCTPAVQGDSTCSQADPFRKNCPGETLDLSNCVENMDAEKYSEDGLKSSGIKESEAVSRGNLSCQSTIDERKSWKKITYVKRKSNQLVAFSNSSDPSLQSSEKPHALSSDGYYKRRKNQLVRTSIEDNTKQLSVNPVKFLNSQRQEAPKSTQIRRSSKRQTGFGKKKSSLVWTLHGTLSSEKDGNSGHIRTIRPFLFPWKRAAYWRNFKHSLSSMPNDNLASAISRKLLLSRKIDTIYKRSFSGFSLRRSKALGFCGRSLKWSKSIERNSRKANEDATLAVAAVEKRKTEQNGAAFTLFKSRNYISRERIFRIGSERYRMDPTGKTLQRISDEKPSYLEDQSENKAKKSFVPRRLLIGNDEYVRIGNGNQLVRDPKKRTRVLANEKVRWSLHTARLRLARKKKYCQFFTRFGKCNKDDKKCPYLHDPSKIAVCTKFLNGCCSDSNCKLTHEVIPERMQDCSYFLRGLCSNESCPYRHVNVNPNSPICEGFLRGYCADGNECRKKHTYVCPVFEATGNCEQGPKCKLHHPKTKKKGIKSKASIVQKNARGRYFGAQPIDIASTVTTVPKLITGECDDHIFCQDGKYTDFISLDDGDEATEEVVEPRVKPSFDSGREEPSEIQVDLDELIKPIRIMKRNLELDSSPAMDSTGEMTGSCY